MVRSPSLEKLFTWFFFAAKFWVWILNKNWKFGFLLCTTILIFTLNVAFWCWCFDYSIEFLFLLESDCGLLTENKLSSFWSFFTTDPFQSPVIFNTSDRHFGPFLAQQLLFSLSKSDRGPNSHKFLAATTTNLCVCVWGGVLVNSQKISEFGWDPFNTNGARFLFSIGW